MRCGPYGPRPLWHSAQGNGDCCDITASLSAPPDLTTTHAVHAQSISHDHHIMLIPGAPPHPQIWWRRWCSTGWEWPICMLLRAVWRFEGPYWRSISRGGRACEMCHIPKRFRNKGPIRSYNKNVHLHVGVVKCGGGGLCLDGAKIVQRSCSLIPLYCSSAIVINGHSQC